MIDHVNAYVLSVRDLDGCISFYQEKLGFKLKDKTEDFAYLVCANNGPGLGLVLTESAAKMISPETRFSFEHVDNRTHWNYFAML